MRRIIERTVTVVTTTTWKISWEADAPQTPPQVDRISDESATLEELSSDHPPKEDDPSDTEIHFLQDEPSEPDSQ